MAIEVSCSGCGRPLQVGPEHAGKMARCPVCSHITPVPAATERASPLAAVPGAAPVAAPLPGSSLWYLRTPEGQEFGPAPRSDLDRWVNEGRVTADCQLRDGEFGLWQNANEVFPALTPPAPVPVWTPPSPYTPAATVPGSPYADRPGDLYPAASSTGSNAAGNRFAPGAPYAPVPTFAPGTSYQTPHRGALILVLGLLGIFFTCVIFSIMAWVMGSNDLREMEAGRMDRSGMDLTRAGMILGMIVSVLTILAFLGMFALIFLGAIAG